MRSPSGCDRCVGLCCVALAFDRSASFAFDKPAGVPCPNLDAEHRCRIHAHLRRSGFSGCTAYDCGGAGPRVVNEVFGGSPESHPTKMLDAFRILRDVQELALLLRTAASLGLEPHFVSRRRELERALDAERQWTLEALLAFEAGELPSEIRAFLGSLKRSKRLLRVIA